MNHLTIGRTYNEGAVALVECISNGPLDCLDIQGDCFLLVILAKGTLEFLVGGRRVTAVAPAFVCFDESENPVLLSSSKARYTCVYFHPQFLNINMTLERLRAQGYEDVASVHDLFLLKPFLDKAYVIPIVETQVEKIQHAADCMRQELTEQRDWYWSCRGRSYFMEIIITLERMYGLIGYGLTHQQADNAPVLRHPKLRDAVLYIEGHYSDSLTLSDIAANAEINQTTLNTLMKAELECTAVEYLSRYRITMAKKQLAFTEVPIKDIAAMVGFKTVQHFNRIFKEITGITPAAFRKAVVKKRKDEFQ